MLDREPARDAAADQIVAHKNTEIRAAGASRRLLLGGSLAALGVAAGIMPRASFVSDANAQGAPAPAQPKGPQPFDYPGKDKGLTLLGDRPLVAETPESLLNDDTTPMQLLPRRRWPVMNGTTSIVRRSGSKKPTG